MSGSPNAPTRLDRRLVELTGCSRGDATKYIEGGWVRVDGDVVDAPQHPVTTESVTLDPEATLDAAEPATLAWHKPAGFDIADADAVRRAIVPGTRWAGDASGLRVLKRHFARLRPGMPLGPEDAGLMVWSQDGRVLKHLADHGVRLEQEWLVDVDGELAPYGWARIAGGTTFAGWPVAPFKVSWQSERRLRFAIKGMRPGLLRHLCAEVGLQAVACRRLRIGRIPLAKMAPGEWRHLVAADRF